MASGLNLFVVPLDKRVDDEILRNAFSVYGELFSAQVARDENGESKGFGFVHFCSVNDGLRAKEEMDDKTFFNRVMHVKFSNKQEGRCNKNGTKSNTWKSDWNNSKSVADSEELESACDDQSQYSYATTADSNTVEIPGIKERMKKLFKSQSFTDVTFYSKDNRKESISAHRAILAISSPLFSKMLYDRQSTITAGEKLEVHISNLPFDAFTCIVRYLYTDEICLDNEILVQGILDGAKEFSIDSLVTKCKEYFENVELTNDNVCSKLEMCISNKITVLKERCIAFIQKNTLPVIQSSDFQKCNSTTIRTICKLQSFNLRSEMELLEAVMHWLHAQPYDERKRLLEPMLKCIRVLNLTVGELGEVLKMESAIMTAEEGLSIMLFLYNTTKNPNFASLPPWCNKNMNNRCFFQEDLRTSQMELNVVNPRGALMGKVFFPLKSDPGQGFVSELTSLLQMKCVSGFHEIKAIKLAFERPKSEQCRINSLLIKIHVTPSEFRANEQVQIVNSETVRVEFRKIVKLRRGDTLDIEAEAKGIKLYKFLRFDETGRTPSNPHFNIFISSSPKQGKLYFISEIEYGPQVAERWKYRNTKKCIF